MKKSEFIKLAATMERILGHSKETCIGEASHWKHLGLCSVSRAAAYKPKYGFRLVIKVQDSIAYYFKDNDEAFWLGTRFSEDNFYRRAMVIYTWEQIILDSGEYKKW